jgi:hypothetical protein
MSRIEIYVNQLVVPGAIVLEAQFWLNELNGGKQACADVKVLEPPRELIANTDPVFLPAKRIEITLPAGEPTMAVHEFEAGVLPMHLPDLVAQLHAYMSLISPP